MYTLNIINNKEMPFLQYIDLGIKKAECRIATPYIKNFKIGETLLLINNKDNEYVKCTIEYLHFYKSFEEMIASEKVNNLVPFVKTETEALKIYKSFPGSNRVKSFGCCAIGVKSIESKLNFKI